jgi:copper homeostasis protein (lipoprotein)
MVAMARPQANPLPVLPATFTGSYICADCPKMQYQLNLYPDDSFFMRATVTGQQTTGTTDDIGSWVLSSDRTVLVLKGQGDSLDMYSIGPNGSLKKLEVSTKPLPGHLPDNLIHAAAFKPLTADLQTMHGAYSMADRPMFVECSTGQRWPVADEGAAAEIEAAYLKARPGPGASVMAEIEGVATPGSGHEGGSVVIRKFKRLLPRDACAPRYTNAPLAGTYWRLTALAGQTVAAPSDPRRELSLTFQPGDGSSNGSYSGSSGCNRLVGTYATTDAAMTLTAGGTLVACKDLAQAESAFLNALKATRRYRISGEMLELFDNAGIRVARFTAQPATGATRR